MRKPGPLGAVAPLKRIFVEDGVSGSGGIVGNLMVVRSFAL
jgi:hypothetical protein